MDFRRQFEIFYVSQVSPSDFRWTFRKLCRKLQAGQVQAGAHLQQLPSSPEKRVAAFVVRGFEIAFHALRLAQTGHCSYRFFQFAYVGASEWFRM